MFPRSDADRTSPCRSPSTRSGRKWHGRGRVAGSGRPRTGASVGQRLPVGRFCGVYRGLPWQCKSPMSEPADFTLRRLGWCTVAGRVRRMILRASPQQRPRSRELPRPDECVAPAVRIARLRNPDRSVRVLTRVQQEARWRPAEGTGELRMPQRGKRDTGRPVRLFGVSGSWAGVRFAGATGRSRPGASEAISAGLPRSEPGASERMNFRFRVAPNAAGPAHPIPRRGFQGTAAIHPGWPAAGGRIVSRNELRPDIRHPHGA